ncbi:MAG: response regulator [Clostridia bacterium]|nr:response regulator [Clostridia bacterium]
MMEEMRLSALAHDMRAPLQAVDMLAELIDAHAENAAAVRGYARRLHAACMQLSALAGEMGERADGSRFSLCVPEAIAREAALLYGGRIALACSGDCLRPAALDVRGVRRILANLLHNAVKYTPSGGRITLETHADGDRVRFCVRDEGIGMGEETMRRLFLPYARGEEAKALPGTGLGLYASRMLAQGMGGALTAESRIGAGSAFTLSLPLPKPERVLGGMRILAAEDNELAGDALCEMLQSCGAQAVRARDGMQAARLFAPGSFDAVLMDLQMPGMDGLEAAAQMRKQERGGAARAWIAGLTGECTATTARNARASGMDECFLKPLSMDVLAAAYVFRKNLVAGY